MKKILLLIVFGIVLSICSCDAGLEIIDMEIVNYPNKIVYYMGIDDELDFTGGSIKYFHKEKTTAISDMEKEIGFTINVIHNVDFNTPGVYVVELYRNNKANVKFPVQVIDTNNLSLFPDE